MRRHPGLIEAAAGGAFLALLLAMACLASWLWPGDPLAFVSKPLRPPFTDPHLPLGSDRLGRDVAAMLAHAAGNTLLIAGSATAAAFLVGVVLGTVAGFAGGLLDEFLMRIVEAFQVIPGFLLALALVAILGPSLPVIVLAIAAGAWPAPARLTRAEVRSWRSREFVDAARLLGMPPARIAFCEVLPNALPPVLSLIGIITAAAILVESALSFLGLGDPNRITWGRMVADGRSVLRSAPALTLIPGTAICLTVLSVGIAGDGLTRLLDPRRLR
ncbi:peptide/nickel transport system permease protein [Arboricoccus pini]|uniref:Peptide/nickel transport system permease protein n=1 Tax=Arboricoccus pini TaxID=1963835 RepID=A0A212QMW3_9PROT|nr:ABC transporter permease [Arboricoccus pini]SNB60709.1 peptide/nickel transport system permease protein [Arboricoccus pini]